MNDVFTWPVGRAAEADPSSSRIPAPLLPVATYAAAATIGGIITAVVFAFLGGALRVLPHGALAVATPLGVAAVVLQFRGRVAPLPQRRAQVPRTWLLWRSPARTAAAYGLMIGAGALTRLRHATTYLVLISALLAPSPLVAVQIGCAYGGTRGIALVITWASDRWRGRRIRWDRLLLPRRCLDVGLAGYAALVMVVLVLVYGA